MAISISGIALFALLSVVFWRAGRVTTWAFLCVFLFGFFVAGTGAAPTINNALFGVFKFLGGH